MAHLLNVWPSVSARLLREERVLLLFDYDGTLTPIVARPEDALMPPDVRRSLAGLIGHPRYIVGIVSGRSLDDLAALAAVPGIIHAGNHGMEIRGPELEFTHGVPWLRVRLSAKSGTGWPTACLRYRVSLLKTRASLSQSTTAQHPKHGSLKSTQ